MEMFEAGRYYVGDLCYNKAIDWKSFIAESEKIDFSGGQITVDGTLMWFHTTAYGDGTFKDNSGREYMVDAGLIGVIRVSDDITEISGGQIIEFYRDFTPHYDNGNFFIHTVNIQTGDEDDYYDDYYNEDEDEDDYYNED